MYRTLSGSLGTQMGMSPAGSLLQQTVHRLWLEWAGAQLKAPFRIYSLNEFGELTSKALRPWLRVTRASSQAVSETTAQTDFWKSVTWYMLGMNPLGLLVYVTGDRTKATWGCSWFLRSLELFPGLQWGPWFVGLYFVSLPSQDVSAWSWDAPGFHSLLPESQSSHIRTFACGWMTNCCYKELSQSSVHSFFLPKSLLSGVWIAQTFTNNGSTKFFTQPLIFSWEKVKDFPEYKWGWEIRRIFPKILFTRINGYHKMCLVYIFIHIA